MPSSSPSIRPLALLFCLAVMLLPAAAMAGPAEQQDFQRHYDQGVKLYQEGHFADSIQEFNAAYQLRQFPRILYNLGRAHFQLGHASEALDCFTQFLKLEPDAPPEIQAKVRDNMAQAQSMLEAARHLQQPTPPLSPVPPAQGATEPVPAQAPPPAPKVVTQPVRTPPPIAVLKKLPTPPRPERTFHGRPLWRIGTGATAAAVGLVLVGLGAGAISVDGQCGTPAVPPAVQCDQVFRSLGPGVAMLTVGAVVAGGGLALALWPGHRPRARN